MNLHTDFKIELHVIQVIAVVSLFINLFQSGSGYIINEEGHLVPFKIYKKGGSRLHPRNCRGGFHKRLTGDPQEEFGDNGFDFQIRKRQQQQQEQSDIFDPPTGTQLFPKPLPPNTNNLGSRYLSSEFYSIFPSLKTNYNSNDKEGSSKKVVTSLENMHEANQLLNDLSRGLGHVEDSPPVKTLANIKSAPIDYPDYDLWAEDFSNIYNTENESNRRRKGDKEDLNSSEKMIFYQYGPRYQVQWSGV